MIRRVEFHELARADLVEAWSWYEAKSSGLGDRLVASLDAAIDPVVRWPLSGSPAIERDDEVVERRVVVRGFPYLARYRVSDHTILVTAIYHERPRPEHAADRPR